MTLAQAQAEAPPDEGPATTDGFASRHTIGLLYLAAALALLAHAVAYALGWADARGPALVVFYLGTVVLVASFAVLLTMPGASHRQRLAGSVAYGSALYVSWLLASPVMATRFDETLHVTTLLALLQDGLFAPNAMLPVSPHYPGIELAAAGIVWLTGVPLMVAQVAVVLAARVVLVVALFALATRIGGSSRVGSTAVLLYSGSAHFYFFNAQFSYQTVAVAMLVVSMVLLLQASDSTGRRTWLLMASAQAALAALMVTHHLTSWMTLVALWVIAGLLALGGERRRARLTLVTAEVATLVAALWTTVVAPLLVGYLAPLADEAGGEIVRLLTLDDTGSRAILESGSGTPTPLWQTGLMFVSILVWCLLLLPAVIGAVRGTTMTRSSARLLLVGVAAAYPVLYAVRFFPTAAEIADRASSFVTLATAVLVALWVVPRLDRFRQAVAPTAVVIVLGGLMLGGGQDWQRVPGPYLPGAEQRSVDATTISFARWAGRYLPEGSRIASDVTINRVVPNFAPVVPVTQQASGTNLTPVFIADTVDDEVVAMLQETAVDFVVVDTRTIGVPALSGSYYEAGSAFSETADQPTAQMLLKFRGAPGFDQVLDGPILVFDVRSLRGEPATFADRPDPGLPGTWTPWQVGVASLLLGLVLVHRRRSVARVAGRVGGPDLWRLALVLPVAMVLGVVGVAVGLGPLTGLAVLGLGALLLLRRGSAAGPDASEDAPDSPHEPSIPAGPWNGVLLAVAGAVVVVAVAVAVTASWTALVDEELPASWSAPVPGAAAR